MEAKIIGKVEVVAVKDSDGKITYESDLTFYKPGCFAQGCALLDAICDSTENLEAGSNGNL